MTTEGTTKTKGAGKYAEVSGINSDKPAAID